MATTYLTRAATTGGSTTKGTFSAWIKRSEISVEYPRLYTSYVNSTNWFEIYFKDDDRLAIYVYFNSTVRADVVTTAKYRDTSGYYNIVVACDTDQVTPADRIKTYINGVQETAFDTATYPGSGDNMKFNGAANTDVIGRNQVSTNNYFNGLMTHIQWVDGAQLAPTEFGEVDATSGIWKIKTSCYATPGTNGFCLKMETTSGSGMGTDSSGNGNNFTENGSPTQAVDNPSNVMCTWNNLAQPNGTLSNGNTSNLSTEDTPGTLGVNTGKWFWETKRTNATNSVHLGICSSKRGFNKTSAQFLNGETDSVGASIYVSETAVGNTSYADSNGAFSSTSYSGVSTPSISNGDVVGCALDISTSSGTIEWFNNGVSFGSATFTYDDSVFVFPFIRINSGATTDTNFGNGYFGTTAVSSAGTSSTGDDSIWEYDCPTGYYGLNTKNINTYG